MDKKHKGAQAELIACAWLLKQGYEVYRNVSPWGLCDVLATLNGKYFKFDVKTMVTEATVTQLTHAQIEAGVLLLGVHDDGRCVIDPARPNYGSTICKECGATFQKTQTSKVFCDKKCTVKFWGRMQIERRRAWSELRAQVDNLAKIRDKNDHPKMC